MKLISYLNYMLQSLWQKLGFSGRLSANKKFKNEDWLAKHIPLEHAASKIPNGSHLFIGSTAATAKATLDAIVSSKQNLLDINILQFIPGGPQPHLEQNVSRFRTTTFFAFGNAAEKIRQGMADYSPISSARVHRLLNEKHIPIDVALVKVTPPNSDGWCSLGTGVDISLDAVRNAEIVIAEVCEYMPWTQGASLIHTQDINWWTEHNEPLSSSKELFPHVKIPPIDPEVLTKLAENVLFEIPDGATLKFDLSAFSNNIVPFLRRRKNLGLHTDLLNNQLLELIKEGVITNSEKNINQGKTIVCHAYGSKELFEYVHKNPNIEFHSSYKVNRLDKIARQDNLISIVGGLKVDLSGQVAVDSVGNRFYAGIGSSDDSIRGAGYSKGGKPIVVLPSISHKGNSNIVFSLPEGTGVAVTRLDVHYVITEYGTAFLFGKSIRERCLALIDIAHPDFRESLLQQAKSRFLVHSHQPGHSFTSSYPKKWECIHETNQQKAVLVRPIKAVDEDHLRDFFHKLSDQNVYMRYFTQMRSLPQKILKHYSDIDYSKDMALIALSPPETAQHEIVGIAQWITDTDDNVPEIAFQIRDDWQAQGLGKFLFLKLIEIANDYQIPILKADVLSNNQAMNRMFESVGIRYSRKLSFGVYS